MRAFALLLLATACPPAGSGTEASFRIFYPDASAGVTAHVGKRFFAKPAGQCTYPDGRDARWSTTGARVASGELPAGLTLEDGAIGGTPKSAGTATLQIRFAGVTCAGKPYPDQTVDITITVR